MTEKQKRTLILASIIGTLFSCYDDDEKTRLHLELHKRIGVGVRKWVKQYGEDTVTQVAHVDGAGIWKDAVDHFADKKITIEASACVLSLWNLDEKSLAKHFGLGAGKLGKWAKPSRREDRVELEKASREVAKYVYAKINDLYGIKEEKKMSVLEMIAAARKSV